MEGEAAAAAATTANEGTSSSQCNRSLSRKASSNSSFRLRCPSLNSLRLRRVFDMFDKNADNMITVQEMNQALARLGLDTDLSELESTIKSFIKPGNDGLEFEDFVALHQSLDETFFGMDGGGEEGGEGEGEGEGEEEEATGRADEEGSEMSQEESDLTEAFKVFDEDGDGFISAQELQVVLGKLGLPEAREMERVQQMICSVDQNHDGRVDFFEFKHMMRRVIVRSS